MGLGGLRNAELGKQKAPNFLKFEINWERRSEFLALDLNPEFN